MTDSCIFCRILRGEVPSTIVAESAKAIAFRDVDPKAPVHVIIVPRRHVPSLDDASDGTELGEILMLAAHVARQEGLSSGYRTVINTGEHGGQSVAHLHAHVLGGRKMDWPPG